MFRSTPWSLVLQAADPASTAGKQALGELFELSWFPLYAFLRRSGHSAEAAEESVQGFFAKLVEKKMLAGLSQGRGRFRNFMLVCLKRHVAHEREKANAQKRGGGVTHFRISAADREDADRRYQMEPATNLTPEKIYQRRWAVATLDRALGVLAESWREAGKQEQFDVLKVYLTGGTAPSHAEVAKQIGMSVGAVKTA
ncbi:MAG: RNA polymerase subunit sigma-24, partial [Lacipirellulaceae bacterium]